MGSKFNGSVKTAKCAHILSCPTTPAHTVGHTAPATTLSGRQGGLGASCGQSGSGNLPWGAIPTQYALPSHAL